jgi:pimeloyl-ACP methyl ester carboxylesterase
MTDGGVISVVEPTYRREMALDAWRAQGRSLEVFGRRVFVVDRAGPTPDAPVLCILHGFPSSSGDWALVLDAFARKFRVVVHDHLGFGFSEKPRPHVYSLFDQAELALGVWCALGVTRAHLIAHDYGTSVCTEILARRETVGVPVDVASVTLSNGSVHLELAQLIWSQYILRSRFGPLYARLASSGLFVRRMRNILRKQVPREVLEEMFAGIEESDGRAVLPALAQYIGERERHQPRWVAALTRLNVPAHVLWAQDDPIARKQIGEKLAGEIPGAVHTKLDALGHYPMLEDPDRYAQAALAFWSRA